MNASRRNSYVGVCTRTRLRHLNSRVESDLGERACVSSLFRASAFVHYKLLSLPPARAMGGSLATRRSDGSPKGRRPPGTHREGRILCASSLGCAPGAILAWVLGLRSFAAVSLVQVGLSVNYWRRPEWGLRRNLDIGCALLLALAVMLHWSSEAQCAYSAAVRLGYTACFLMWARATTAWAAERPSWVWWHACFHALIGSANLVLAWGCGLRLSGIELRAS
jgi:hypothetical protein